MSNSVEQYGIFELELAGPQEGNPFLEVEFGARFKYEHRAVEVNGFYDGDGAYRVRFMPDTQGEWTYATRSNKEELDGEEGSFICGEPSEGNHGPVHVEDRFHFAHADGTPYFQFGTTCTARARSESPFCGGSSRKGRSPGWSRWARHRFGVFSVWARRRITI